MTRKKIALIGECMIEFSQKGDTLRRGFGGDTLNTSVYISRQISPDILNVYYVTALGTDSFSSKMLQAWQQEGINTDLTQRLKNKLPGLYVIETDETGERSFYYWRNDAAARYWINSPQSEEICQKLAEFDYLYLSGISLAILNNENRGRLMNLLKTCRSRGGKIIFDNNYRPRLWESREQTQAAYNTMLSCTDIAFLTLDDESMLWGQKSYNEVIARTHALGVSEVIVKRGADSCIVSDAEGGKHNVPTVKLPKEKVVDTTAAGDSFSAGYLAMRLTGKSALEAVMRGHETASTTIQHNGAIIPIE